MTTDVTLDVFLSKDCAPNSKIAFGSCNGPDKFLNQRAKRIAAAVEAGRFDARMANWSVEELENAQGYVKGVDEVPDGPRYELIPCYIRVSQVMGDRIRDGAHDALSDILGDAGLGQVF